MTMSKLNPDALAPCGDDEMDAREGVQEVTEFMIKWHVIEAAELPHQSAGPFAEWLNEVWNDWNEDGDLTNGQVISGALGFWRGNA